MWRGSQSGLGACEGLWDPFGGEEAHEVKLCLRYYYDAICPFHSHPSQLYNGVFHRPQAMKWCHHSSDNEMFCMVWSCVL